jgi:hypothetical protein
MNGKIKPIVALIVILASLKIKEANWTQRSTDKQTAELVAMENEVKALLRELGIDSSLVSLLGYNVEFKKHDFPRKSYSYDALRNLFRTDEWKTELAEFILD